MRRIHSPVSTLFLLTGLLLCCSCSFPVQNQTDLSADEIPVIQSTFVYDKENISEGILTPEEYHILTAYRFFKEYFSQNYPNDSFSIVSISPGSTISPTGDPYDSFYVHINNCDIVYKFTLIEDDDTYQIIYDEYRNDVCFKKQTF